MNKLTKTFLHLWITFVSIGAFASGWAFLAHEQKQDPLVVPMVQMYTPGQTILEPIPTINDYLTNGTRQAQFVQSPNVTYPQLRTRGS